MDEVTPIREAEFNPRVCVYWLLSSTLILTLSVVGIPIVPFWVLIGMALTRRYLASMSCVLTSKTIEIKKGVLVRVEKTVPLDKITDMGMLQGPIMRHFDFHRLTIETAGQSGPGALVSLTGVRDAKGFREAVLKQREALAESSGREVQPAAVDSGAPAPILAEIRNILLRIEKHLEDRTSAWQRPPSNPA